MCGIVGYVGRQEAAPILLDGLERLEYRGYDSAGIAVCGDGVLRLCKKKGRVAALRELTHDGGDLPGTLGIGHTRWATHGEPSDVNSHPHSTPRVSIVHNGIIENYGPLKADLMAKGVTFESETDTEVLVRLIDYFCCTQPKASPLTALREALGMVRGSYALGVLFRAEPDTIYAVKKESPLIVGWGEGENFVASDIPALLKYTRRYSVLEEGDMAVVKADGIRFYDAFGKPVEREVLTADWDEEAAEKGGYPHFMLKEIHEQPRALADTIDGRTKDGFVTFEGDGLPDGFFRDVTKLYVSACGTAMYSGMVGKAIIEKLARLPVEVEVASELRYRDPIFTPGCAAVVVSQSGETADTLAALRLFKENHIPVIGIVNVVGSSIAREADYCLYTYAGPEIAVASTKAYSVQVAMMYLLGFRIAADKGAPMDWCRRQLPKLLNAVSYLPHVLAMEPEFFRYAEGLKNAEHLFYLGRGLDYSLAMEGSLKLKEISYIHCEAYAAGELKHGTISLITDGTPVIALATQRKTLGKMISNVKEVKARGAHVLLITLEGLEVDPECYDEIIRLPAVEDEYVPLLLVVTLQLIALGAANARGCDVDKPRNLAKSVTVE